MSSARFIIGDTRDVVAKLPDHSVDLVLTSPPFLALRSYLPADHPDKHREIGSEPTPATFVQTLLDLTGEWLRVLAPHGSIVVELGDTYSGQNESGWDRLGARAEQPDQPSNYRKAGTVSTSGSTRDLRRWPLAKSICGIPWLYALSLAYGRNLLTGEASPAGMLRVRNVVAWCRPNPPVGALGDKFRPATSYLTVACPSDRRWFDLDAVRDKSKAPNPTPRAGRKEIENPDRGTNTQGTGDNAAGAPPLDYWEITTQPYSGSHYATFPPELCVRPILSMCPPEVCTACGTPRSRIVDVASHGEWRRDDRDAHVNHGGPGSHGSRTRMAETVGWSDCGCGAPWRRGVVLDPFAGSGTTLAVATGHGRDAIGIDLDERHADLARERVGMFLEVDRG